jgi:hypothetical protein
MQFAFFSFASTKPATALEIPSKAFKFHCLLCCRDFLPLLLLFGKPAREPEQTEFAQQVEL